MNFTRVWKKRLPNWSSLVLINILKPCREPGFYPAQTRRFLCRTTKQARRAVISAADALKAGRLVILPTDTVYGLSARPEAGAIQLIYRAKGRQENNPLVLLVADIQAAAKYAGVTPRAEAVMLKYWPGALTLVLPVKPGTPWGRVTRGGRSIALRIPNHDLTRRIIREAGGALVMTSANRTGCPAPASASTIDKKILAFSEIVVDAGKTRTRIHSTIVKLSGHKLKVLRQGSIKI